ncbi:MAG: flagellar hook-length control protein FliK [Lachnospiraceae bacterium]|nr:flagellar hook-length control protein FliK [Lachnospiraceae bacterium]
MKEINAVTPGSQVYPAVPGSGRAAGTMKGAQSFDSFLNTSSNASTVNVKADTAGKVPSADAGSSTPKTADTAQTADASSTSQPVQDNSTEVTDTGTDSATQAVTDTGDNAVSEAGGAVTEVNNVIKEAVKDITGLDDEALAEIMEVLGMQFVDLLDMGNLKQFVMYINNTSDVTDLLMDESIMSQLNNLADVIADIDIEAVTGMTEDNFARLLQDMADGNMAASDGSFSSQAAGQGTQQAADIPVTVEYEEDVPAGQKEAVQAETAGSGVEESGKDAAKQGTEQAGNGKFQADGGAEEGTGTKTIQAQENQGSFKQGTGSQTDSTLAESTLAESAQAEARPVREETFNGQAGFIQNIAQAAADVQEGAVPQKVNMQTMINIVNQVVEQIKVTMGRETTSMQLQLNPESLGKVLISVTANHGVMTANFTVQSEEAKEALQSQMFSLREALESRNLKVDAVEVEVSDFAFSQSGQADAQDQKEFEKGSGRRFRFDAGGSGEEEGTDTDVSGKQGTQRLDMGSSIDFTA